MLCRLITLCLACGTLLAACGGGSEPPGDIRVTGCGESPVQVPVPAGQATTCSVRVYNLGSVATVRSTFTLTLANELSLRGLDCLPGKVACPSILGASFDLPPIPPDEWIDFSVSIGTQAGQNGVFKSTASVAQRGEESVDNNSSDFWVAVFSTDLSMSASGPAAVTAGTDVVFAGVVSNLGPALVVGTLASITLSDGLAYSSIACTLADGSNCPVSFNKSNTGWVSAPGDVQTWRFTVHIPNSYSGPFTAILHAYSAGDPVPANNDATVTAVVIPSP